MADDLTAPRFAWAQIGLGDYPPDKPRNGDTGALCWLCGGPTHGVGWKRKAAIPVTFADGNLARHSSATAVCQPCAGFAGGDTWQAYVAAHPDRGIKVWAQASWRNYSHLFRAGGHECPTRRRWRDILLEPPEPPFVAVLTEVGKKNLIWRAPIALDRDLFGVQFEEIAVTIRRRDYAACLAAFERLTALGFGKAQVLSGRYNATGLKKAGLRPWQEAEAEIAPWRLRETDLMHLVAHVAIAPDIKKTSKEGQEE